LRIESREHKYTGNIAQPTPPFSIHPAPHCTQYEKDEPNRLVTEARENIAVMVITALALVAGGFILGTFHGIRKGKQTRARSDIQASRNRPRFASSMAASEEEGAEGNQGPVAAEDQGQIFSPPVNPLVEAERAGAGAGAAREGAGAGAAAYAHHGAERQLEPITSELKEMTELRDQGILTEAEFVAEKDKILAASALEPITSKATL
jgi:hypothetical protein